MKSITKELLVQSAIAILSIASRILNETYTNSKKQNAKGRRIYKIIYISSCRVPLNNVNLYTKLYFERINDNVYKV